MSESRFQIVFMTASKLEEAEQIAEVLVEKNLAACVNIVESCRSIYQWKGEIVKDHEVMMFAKTKRDDFDTIVRTVTGIHSYDVPEIIATNLESLSEGYSGFLVDVLGE